MSTAERLVQATLDLDAKRSLMASDSKKYCHLWTAYEELHSLADALDAQLESATSDEDLPHLVILADALEAGTKRFLSFFWDLMTDQEHEEYLVEWDLATEAAEKSGDYSRVAALESTIPEDERNR